MEEKLEGKQGGSRSLLSSEKRVWSSRDGWGEGEMVHCPNRASFQGRRRVPTARRRVVQSSAVASRRGFLCNPTSTSPGIFPLSSVNMARSSRASTSLAAAAGPSSRRSIGGVAVPPAPPPSCTPLYSPVPDRPFPMLTGDEQLDVVTQLMGFPARKLLFDIVSPPRSRRRKEGEEGDSDEHRARIQTWRASSEPRRP